MMGYGGNQKRKKFKFSCCKKFDYSLLLQLTLSSIQSYEYMIAFKCWVEWVRQLANRLKINYIGSFEFYYVGKNTPQISPSCHNQRSKPAGSASRANLPEQNEQVAAVDPQLHPRSQTTERINQSQDGEEPQILTPTSAPSSTIISEQLSCVYSK